MELVLFIKMIKLINILNEGIIQLTSNEKNQVEKLLPKIIDIIQGPLLKPTDFIQVGSINFESADKTPGFVQIFVGNDSTANGYFQTRDPKNLKDDYIVIQQNSFKDYFDILSKGKNIATGDANLGIEKIRGTLNHELIHAKDPGLNQHKLKEPYDASKPEVYYKSWTEFQTMTGQFFESIFSGVDRIMSEDPSSDNIKKIEKSFNEILNFFAGKSKKISQSTLDFIQGTDKRNIFQRLIRFLANDVNALLGKQSPNALINYITYLYSIKHYNPEGYKEFQKDLYKVIDQLKDKINLALKTANSSYSAIELKENTIKKSQLKQLIKEEIQKHYLPLLK